MKQDYLDNVLPPQGPDISADQLPDGNQIREAEREAAVIHESLDMISFTEKEREQVGPASTPEELELNRLYAELTAEFTFLMPLIDRPEGALSSGYQMERALSVYREANDSLLQVSRSVLLICAGDLTEKNDDAEEAASTLAEDAQVPADQRAVIRNAARSLDRLRGTQQQAQAQRQLRRQHKQKRAQAALQLSQKRQTQTHRLADMEAAPLPALQDPHKTKK